jgi:hypothetical protein
MSTAGTRQWVSGLTVVALGLVLLAVNLGWLHIDFWTLVWRFWPLALILAGLRLLITSPVLNAVLAAAMLAAAVWAVSYAPEPIRSQLAGVQGSGQTQEQTIAQPLRPSDDRLNLKLEFGAAAVEVSALEESGQAYRAQFINSTSVEQTVKRSSGTIDATLTPQSNARAFWEHLGNRRAHIMLNPTIPVQFELEAGAAKNNLDFSNINLERLVLDVGASSTQLKLGTKAQDLQVVLDAGASSLTLRVPRSAELRIITDSALSTNNFASLGLVKTGDIYETSHVASASGRITVQLDAGASSIKLEQY